MKHSEGKFKGAGGLELYYQCWQPDGQPRAVVVIVHGIGEHSGRYMNVVNQLVPHGYAVYSFDNRGHGRSPGQRGYLNAWAEFREDVRAFLKKVREQEPGRSVFLMGHSLGSLIVGDYVLRDPSGLKGTILSGLATEPAGAAPAYLVAIARLLSRLWPTFSMASGLEAAAISRDPAAVQAYQADPLVHDRVTPRYGTEALATVEWVKTHASEMKIPVLLLHGGADRLVSSAGSQRFFEAVPLADKELHIYPDGYHEPHNDLQHEQVMADLEGWLERHL